MRLRVKGRLVAGGVVLVLGTLCSYSFFAYADSSKKTNSAINSTGIAVEATTVKTADFPQSVQALGSLEAQQKVMISAEDSGRVTAINFNSGQQVVKGMPIATLDDNKAKAEYQSAVTSLQVIESKYKRSKLLLNEAISQQELDQLSADVEAAKANVQKAQSLLDDKQVDAPFNGVLDTVKVQVGDYVNVGDPIVEIVNIDKLWVDYNIPEQSLPKLKTGQLVQVTVESYPNKVFYGTVNYISPVIDTDTRSVAVRATINNEKGLLSPGMYVHVSEQTSVTKDALVLPAEAVQVDIKGYYVYVVKGNQALQQYITIGQRKGNQVQILKGLSKGEEVVSAGQQKLNDGSEIRVINKVS